MNRSHADVQALVTTPCSRYCFGADLIDESLLIQCFDEKTRFGLKGTDLTQGGAEIVTQLSRGWIEGMIHQTMNILVDRIEGDTVYSRANFAKISQVGGIISPGFYEDVIQLDGTAARFVEPTITYTWNYS